MEATVPTAKIDPRGKSEEVVKMKHNIFGEMKGMTLGSVGFQGPSEGL